MKKTMSYLLVLGMYATVACTEKPAEVKKEVIVVPAQPAKEEKPVVVVKEPAEKSTTVSLGKNGVKVTTKKVDISVKKQ